jgi:hypothetical protein
MMDGPRQRFIGSSGCGIFVSHQVFLKSTRTSMSCICWHHNGFRQSLRSIVKLHERLTFTVDKNNATDNRTELSFDPCHM